MKILENKKICNWNLLPKEIKSEFIECYGFPNNDTFRTFTLYNVCKSKNQYKGGKIISEYEDTIIEIGDCIISDYFYDLGCEIDEEIIILYLW